MNRTSTLIAIFVSLFTLSLATPANSTNYVNNGNSTAYILYAGDSLHIASGTYTGIILNWQEGAKISVASGATFKPNSFSYFLGTIYVYGSATVSSINGQSSSFYMRNYGIITITGDTYLGNNATIQNNYGATLNFNGDVDINSSRLYNEGTMVVRNDFYAGSGAAVYNNNLLTVEGNLEINGSTAVNGGMMYTKRKLTFSNATITNNCRTIADNGIEISGGTVNNNALLYATTALNNSYIINGGSLVSTITSRVKSTNFTNNGTLTGNGYFYFTGTTINNSGARVGRSGTTSDSIRVYDASRSGSNIFDNNWGTVYANTKFVNFASPNTDAPYISCSLSYMSAIVVLPVKWTFFNVNLSANVPQLSWGSEQEAGTRFEIQRSYDGNNFSPINMLVAAADNRTYQYSDADVNSQAAVVYYRIRAIEANGAEKYSETRTVRFINKNGISLQVSPNPFTSQFSLGYQANTSGTITVKVYSMNGRLQASKQVAVSRGFNSIAVSEVAQAAKCIYLVQVLDNNNQLIASEKIAKQ